MHQTVIPDVSKELKLQKTIIVKLNMKKVTQLAESGPCSKTTLTTASTAPDCDITITSTTGGGF